jgi:hypothetical protein
MVNNTLRKQSIGDKDCAAFGHRVELEGNGPVGPFLLPCYPPRVEVAKEEEDAVVTLLDDDVLRHLRATVGAPAEHADHAAVRGSGEVLLQPVAIVGGPPAAGHEGEILEGGRGRPTRRGGAAQSKDSGREADQAETLNLHGSCSRGVDFMMYCFYTTSTFKSTPG